MQNTQRTILIVAKLSLIFIVGFLSSCKYNQHLKEGQKLLRKNTIKIIDSATAVSNKSELIEGMTPLLRQQPNTNLIGVRFLPRYKLWKYNRRYNYYEQNPAHEKIRERKVEAPVVTNGVLMRLSDTALKQFMVNNGYYYSTVSDTLFDKKNQEAAVQYSVTPGKRYYIKDIQYNIADQTLKANVLYNSGGSFIKKGRAFRNIDFGRERERLYKMLRNEGYFTLKTENITCELDTIDRSVLQNAIESPLGFDIDAAITPPSKDSVVVYISVLPTRDTTFDAQFTLDRVYVKFIDPYHDPINQTINEVQYRDIIFQYYNLPVRRNIIYDNIFLHQNEQFAAKNVDATFSRLNQLGTFQVVDIQFQKSVRTTNGLDCYIELTLAKKSDIQLNSDISTGEQYLLGLGAGVNLNTKNIAKGANKLQLSSQYSLETRPENRDRIRDGLLLSANNFSSSVNLTLPRFLIPFKWNTSRNNTPFTTLSLSHSRITRVRSFKLINTTANLKYNWRETPKKTWEVSPIFMSLTNVPPSKLSDAFRDTISNSAFLLNTYSTNFIEGEHVGWEYASDLTGTARRFSTLKLGIEEAGFLLQGINALYRGVTGDSINNIAHYLRGDVDYRHYERFLKYELASRIGLGMGVPTFGDVSLPYIKQYSQGGAFSNRGWQLRNLGPGRLPPETGSGLQLVDRTGDIKLEVNTELRFPLAKLGPFNLKGATFIDAGNIWLFNEDPNNPGGSIKLNELWHDIAMSGGFGLRLDFSFFLFRVDHGWKIKKPYKPTSDGWDIGGIKLNEGQWNVAIGYPF